MAVALALTSAALLLSLGDADEGQRQELHLVTFMSKMDRRFTYLQVSAQSHGIYPQLTGLGHNAAWAQLGAKLNDLRTFVLARPDQDIVICADAYDVLVLGNRSEMLQKFESLESESGRSLVFNAEPACFPDTDGICQKTPPAKHRWRFLNAGLIVGRVHAYKAMLRETLPEYLNDQWWFQVYRRDHPDEILLDTGCNLTCALYTTGQDGSEVSEGRIRNLITKTLPPLVHFVSFGHRTTWVQGRATSPLQLAFQQLFPEESKRLMEAWWFGIHVGSTHDLTIYEGPGWWATITAVLCLQCHVMGAQSDDCDHLRGTSRCFWLNLGWFCLLLCFVLCVRLCARGHPSCKRQLRASLQRLPVQVPRDKKSPHLEC